MLRLGLCCLFAKEPIKFRVATATHLQQFDRAEQLRRLSEICLSNARALLAAIEYCAAHDIGCFRINSQILPLKTHPDVGYEISDLPGSAEIKKIFLACRALARRGNIRLTFHPDQFILLSSPCADVVRNSILELDYQAEVGELIGADVINIHAGGGYGDKSAALMRMGCVLGKLKKRIRERLTLENDDVTYTPKDLLPFCREFGIPFVYDVHHHRCLPDGLSVAEVTARAVKTWNREPLFHISSPRSGQGKQPCRPHHDYINMRDFPREWRGMNVTVEIEAKAKELAIRKLQRELRAGKWQ